MDADRQSIAIEQVEDTEGSPHQPFAPQNNEVTHPMTVASTTLESPDTIEEPLYASGCYVLLEVEVDVAALKADEAADRVWAQGPLLFHKRVNGSAAGKLIPLRDREDKLGSNLADLAYGTRRRIHRKVRHQFYSKMECDPARELRVTGLELLLANTEAFFYEDARLTNGAQSRHWTPGIAIVHFELPDAISSTDSGCSSLRDDHLKNILSRLLHGRQSIVHAHFEHMLNSTAHASTRNLRTTDGAIALNGDFDAVLPDSSAFAIRVVTAPTNTAHAALGFYTVLTDVAAESEDHNSRLPDQANHASAAKTAGTATAHAAGAPGSASTSASASTAASASAPASASTAASAASAASAATASTPAQVRATRSMCLAAVRPDLRPDGSNGAFPASDVDWSNWHGTFTTRGAGFSYIHERGRFHPYRREHLSGVMADILALELLKIRILTVFSDLAYELARSESHDGRSQKILGIWQDFVRFTTEYVGRDPGLAVMYEQFRSAFQRGTGQDFDRSLERTENNLNRLAEIARLERAEQQRLSAEAEQLARLQRADERRVAKDAEDITRRDEEDQREREKQRIEAERDRFHLMIGLFATIFLPLSAIPPILEWFYPNPEAATAWIRAVWVLAGVAIVGLVVLGFWLFEKRKRRKEDATDQKS